MQFRFSDAGPDWKVQIHSGLISWQSLLAKTGIQRTFASAGQDSAFKYSVEMILLSCGEALGSHYIYRHFNCYYYEFIDILF